jgi:hypothetical protein
MTYNLAVLQRVSRLFDVGWRTAIEKKSLTIVSHFVAMVFQPSVLRQRFLSLKDSPIKKVCHFPT